MKKTRQFDDIKSGEIIRYLIQPNPYAMRKTKEYWSFGIVSNDYMKNFFSVTSPGGWEGFSFIRIRRDGMDKAGKDAKQIAFRVSPQEIESNTLIQRFIEIKKQIETLYKEARHYSEEMAEGKIDLFPEYPLPEAKYSNRTKS